VQLQSGNHAKFQAMLSEKEIGKESLKAFKKAVDLGDQLHVYGKVISSKRGELSIFVSKWCLASKAIRPLPVLHKELSDEQRMRRPYTDLIVRDDAQKMARLRPKVVQSIREFMAGDDFIELETPILQVLHGGANAKPFSTHINAFDMDLYLRISLELYLKRAVVGGIDRVYELSRNFRNEGVDSSHSPEFSMMEAYQAYGTYDTIGELTKNLIQYAVLKAFGGYTVTLADGTEYDFGGDWKKIYVYPELSKAVGTKITPETTIDELKKHAEHAELDKKALNDNAITAGKLVELLFEHYITDSLYEPTFVYDFPAETSPLTRPHRTEKGIAEKWDLYVRGSELATGYSELVDPVIQREYFTKQSLLAYKGDAEAMQLDEDFLEALEYGMPPTGGMGMGIDRLLMALTGLGIRDIILFPLVKPIEK
jgi:lysyl-tRNA synthetase class 2